MVHFSLHKRILTVLAEHGYQSVEDNLCLGQIGGGDVYEDIPCSQGNPSVVS